MDGGHFFGVFAGIGTVMVLYAAVRVWRAWRTLGWRSTEGVVQSAGWRLKSTDEDSEVHELLVTYSYDVDGVRHAGARVALGGRSFGRRDRADAAVARYAPGTRVTVIHHPRRPAEAVLERERLSLWTLAIAAAGVGMFVSGGVLFPARP
jgi:hypothetical protein